MNESPTPKKIFDVTRPNQSLPTQTSRPIITTNKSQPDPMVKIPASLPEASTPEPTMESQPNLAQPLEHQEPFTTKLKPDVSASKQTIIMPTAVQRRRSTIIAAIIVLVMVVVLIDLLLDAGIVKLGIPHTHFVHT